jgi:hypothetical protein
MVFLNLILTLIHIWIVIDYEESEKESVLNHCIELNMKNKRHHSILHNKGLV